MLVGVSGSEGLAGDGCRPAHGVIPVLDEYALRGGERAGVEVLKPLVGIGEHYWPVGRRRLALVC